MTIIIVDDFSGPFRFLSNNFLVPVDYGAKTYPTVEHGYQAAKTLNIEQRRRIQYCITPQEAKHWGQQVELRPAWGKAKVYVMEHLLKQKFAPGTKLAKALAATGHAELILRNTVDDTFWGVCKNQGRNQLGLLLMEIRRDLDA